jgi:hypothetical protein
MAVPRGVTVPPDQATAEYALAVIDAENVTTGWKADQSTVVVIAQTNPRTAAPDDEDDAPTSPI